MKIKQIIMLGLVISLIIPIINAETIWGEGSARVDLAEGYFCPEPWTDWIDTSKDPFEYFSTAPPIFDCRDPYEGQSCCPIYSKCQAIDNVPTDPLPISPGILGYSCFASPELHCSQFKTQSECEDETTIPLAIASIENNPLYGKNYCGNITGRWKVPGGICWNETSCECIWNSTINNCTAEQRNEQNCTINPPGPQINQKCDYLISYDDSLCNEPGGYILATANLIAGPANCKPTNTYQMPCTEIMRLAFFSWINVIAVIVILIIIYYLYANSKKKKKR